jgi:hypothetical protein
MARSRPIADAMLADSQGKGVHNQALVGRLAVPLPGTCRSSNIGLRFQ